MSNPKGSFPGEKVAPRSLRPQGERPWPEISMDQIRAYRMFQKMARYPHLLDEMREIFLKSLKERGLAEKEAIDREARQKLEQQEEEANPRLLREYTNALIDLYFASSFSDEEIEDYINLARKQDLFRHLNTVLNMEDATAAAIHKALKAFCDIPEGHQFIPPNEAEVVRVALISRFISAQLPFVGIAKKHLTTRDIYDVVEHSVWNEKRSGKVGGKAAGMLLAYRVILPRFEKGDPEIEKYVVLPKSYYFNSGILSDFIEYNEDLHDCYSVKYKPQETLVKTFQDLESEFKKAVFPPSVMDQFREFLVTVGETPLILRSSSRLEDSLGNAFSGKYDSVFVTNQGDLETRLNSFVWGLKQVLLSTLNPSAIAYRRERNLLDFDERMSVLVQEVVGRRFGKYFFPLSAGAAFSINRYKWSPRIDQDAGLVRMVFGLGTRAVDRIGGDYARMVPLSHPQLRPEITAGQITKYSQKMVDVLNLEEGRLETVSYLELLKAVNHPDLYYAVSIQEDSHLSPPMFKGKPIEPDDACITFDNLLSKTPFVPLMKKILGKLHEAYNQPVEVEFAWDQERLYLLQCRSHPAMVELGDVDIPGDIDPEHILFSNNRGTSNSIVKDVEYLVYVDPKAYDRLETPGKKLDVGRAVGEINRIMGSSSKRYGLWGPGRWGSNDINLGVRVGYEDINNTLILGEVCFGEAGSAPEASYGTHFFNDLVEAQIVPMAIYPDDEEVTFDEEFLLEAPSRFAEMAPTYADYAEVVHVIHVPSCTQGRLLYVFQDGRTQRSIGFFAQEHDVFS